MRRRPARRNVGLFPKIAGAMLLAATIPLLVAFFVTTAILKHRQERTAENTLVRLNSQVAGELSRAIDNAQSSLAALAGTDLFADRTVSLTAKERGLRSFERNSPLLEGLTLLDLSGNVLFTTGEGDTTFLKSNPVVRNALQGQAAFSQLETGPGQLDTGPGQPAADPGQETASFIHAVPVSDGRGQWAVLVAQPVRLEAIGRIMRETRIGEEGYSFLVNAEGQIIAHRHPSLLLTPWKHGALLPEAASAMGWVDLEGRKFLCVQQAFSIPYKLGRPWKAVTCQPEGEVFADLGSSQRVLLWSVLGSLGLALLVGFVLSRSLTKPITSLASSARLIQGGDLDHRASITTRDEVGGLASSFNDMAGALAQKIQDIQRERTTLAAIQDSMAEGLVVLDGAGAIVEINQAAETILGGGHGSTRGQAAEPLLRAGLAAFEPPERVRSFLEYALGPAAATKGFQVARSGPTDLSLQVTVFPIRFGRAGRLTGIILRDTTQERELERRRNTFISVASHELRTPLTNMMGYAELLLNRQPTPQRQRQWLQQIHEGTRKLAVIVEDLLNLSRIQAGKIPVRREEVPVEPLLRHALTTVETVTEKHQFALDVEPGLPDIMADGDKLSQVLTNLLDNAVKYSPRGGRITLGAKLERPDSQPLPDAGRGAEVRRRIVISVADQGMGIAPADQEMLFNTFQRISRPETEQIRGSGLGLYIVKELVTLMEGDVWVTSELNQGSTFFVALPVAQGHGSGKPV